MGTRFSFSKILTSIDWAPLNHVPSSERQRQKGMNRTPLHLRQTSADRAEPSHSVPRHIWSNETQGNGFTLGPSWCPHQKWREVKWGSRQRAAKAGSGEETVTTTEHQAAESDRWRKGGVCGKNQGPWALPKSWEKGANQRREGIPLERNWLWQDSVGLNPRKQAVLRKWHDG